MHKDRDFDSEEPLPSEADALVADLGLDTLFEAMARGDRFVKNVGKKAMLVGLRDVDGITYRQDVLKDCIKNPSIVRTIYHIPIELNEKKKNHWWGIFTRRPSSTLYEAREMIQICVELLQKLKAIANEHACDFESDGFKAFFNMIRRELDDDYFSTVKVHLKELEFRKGALISAELGKGNEGTNYVLRKPHQMKQNWIERLLTRNSRSYTFSISDRDEAGARAVGELKDRALDSVANALAQSADHIDAFFHMLQVELAFYIGCLNLSEQLADLDEPFCFPTAAAASERCHSFAELYDVCLALSMNQKIVGNDVRADNKDLAVITGANQGGKSTFLRSIGSAQLMMQCGMFVPARFFSANIANGVFTHYKREEDVTMESGKLDEELARMSAMADRITSNSMALFNESFAATNEREGSELAKQIISALVDRRIKVFFVTHLYEFAHAFYENKLGNAIFLRAERKADRQRTFNVIEGEPLRTSFGGDVYRTIFGGED